jgi:hypothetical protein
LSIKLRFDTAQSRKKTRIRNQPAATSVVDMAVVYCVAQHDFGLVFADHLDHLQLVLFVIDKKPVAHPEIFANDHTKDFRRRRRFLVADFGRTARPEFATCQIDDTNFFPVCHFFSQSAAASEFYIVGMRAKSQYV